MKSLFTCLIRQVVYSYLPANIQLTRIAALCRRERAFLAEFRHSLLNPRGPLLLTIDPSFRGPAPTYLLAFARDLTVRLRGPLCTTRQQLLAFLVKALPAADVEERLSIEVIASEDLSQVAEVFAVQTQGFFEIRTALKSIAITDCQVDLGQPYIEALIDHCPRVTFRNVTLSRLPNNQQYRRQKRNSCQIRCLTYEGVTEECEYMSLINSLSEVTIRRSQLCQGFHRFFTYGLQRLTLEEATLKSPSEEEPKGIGLSELMQMCPANTEDFPDVSLHLEEPTADLPTLLRRVCGLKRLTVTFADCFELSQVMEVGLARRLESCLLLTRKAYSKEEIHKVANGLSLQFTNEQTFSRDETKFTILHGN